MTATTSSTDTAFTTARSIRSINKSLSSASLYSSTVSSTTISTSASTAVNDPGYHKDLSIGLGVSLGLGIQLVTAMAGFWLLWKTKKTNKCKYTSTVSIATIACSKEMGGYTGAATTIILQRIKCINCKACFQSWENYWEICIIILLKYYTNTVFGV